MKTLFGLKAIRLNRDKGRGTPDLSRRETSGEGSLKPCRIRLAMVTAPVEGSREFRRKKKMRRDLRSSSLAKKTPKELMLEGIKGVPGLAT